MCDCEEKARRERQVAFVMQLVAAVYAAESDLVCNDESMDSVRHLQDTARLRIHTAFLVSEAFEMEYHAWKHRGGPPVRR